MCTTLTFTLHRPRLRSLHPMLSLHGLRIILYTVRACVGDCANVAGWTRSPGLDGPRPKAGPLSVGLYDYLKSKTFFGHGHMATSTTPLQSPAPTPTPHRENTTAWQRGADALNTVAVTVVARVQRTFHANSLHFARRLLTPRQRRQWRLHYRTTKGADSPHRPEPAEAAAPPAAVPWPNCKCKWVM